MAITIALHGGIGIIHRFMSVTDQAAEVKTVKEHMRTIEETPPIIEEKSTIEEVSALMKKHKRGYMIVYKGNTFTGIFTGIVTLRDLIAGEKTASINSVMTPRNKLITAELGTSFPQAVAIMKKHRIEKLPIVDASFRVRGVYTLKDSHYFTSYPLASLDNHGRLLVGAAIGVKESDTERAIQLVKAGADVLVLDIAHGHHSYTKTMLHRLLVTEKIKVPIIAGNVATAEGALFLVEHGAKGVKIGIGPGFVCETRDVAGAGIPQVTAILNIAKALKKLKIPLIADGGIRVPGDVALAIASGAHSVMIGSLFAGTAESPGEAVIIDGTLQKMVRGMASASAFIKRKDLGGSTTNAERYVPEGRTTFTPFKGSVVKIIHNLEGGLRSGMSYTGSHSIVEMHAKAKLQVFPPGSHDQRRPLKI
jgi:IMP dehydrogenase